MNEYTIQLNDNLTKVKALVYLGYEIPDDLQAEIIRLMYSYNEELKFESNGK